MSTTTIHVEGTAEVVAALERVRLSTQYDIRQATKKAANDTTTLAKRLAPVDTGRLRSSIRMRDIGQFDEAEVFTDVEYAPYVEWGTRHMQAEPFLGPAWDAIRPYYLSDLVAILRAAGRL